MKKPKLDTKYLKWMFSKKRIRLENRVKRAKKLLIICLERETEKTTN